MHLCSLSSGSSGNCIYVGTEETHLLVDTGVSKKRIVDELHAIDMAPEDIQGILITHEHSDHIQGLGVFTRKYSVPVYGTKATLEAIKRTKALGELDTSKFIEIQPDEPFQIQDMTIEASRTWHDAADPVCYQFFHQGHKTSLCTDLGDYNDYLVEKLKDSDLLFIESNHDVNMLLVGPYSYPLKQRILGDHGHLSNERSGQFIKELLNDHIRGIMLGHLSKENNIAELAYETVAQELTENPFTNDVRDFHLSVARRAEHSEVLYVG